MTEWISVQDRLPEMQERVLVYPDNFGDVNIAWHQPAFESDILGSVESFWHNDTAAVKAPTHWMPFPQPPG